MAKRNDDERSFLWGASAWTALFGGTGYGIYQSLDGLEKVHKTGYQDVTAQTVGHLKNIGRFDVDTRLHTELPNVNSFMLQGLDKTGGRRVKKDIANAAYRSVLAGGQISEAEALAIRAGVLGQSTLELSYGAATNAITRHGGVESLFSSGLNRLGTGGFYDKERMAEFANVKYIKASHMADIGRARQSMSLSQLGDKFGDDVVTRTLDFKKRLGRSTGNGLVFDRYFSIEDVVDGKTVHTPMMRGKIGRTVVTIPLADTGLMYSGEGLATRYVTREAFDEASDVIGFSERYVSKLEQSASIWSTEAGAEGAIKRSRSEFLDLLKTEKSKAMSQAIWSLPEEMSSSGNLAKNRLIRRQSIWAGQGNFTTKKLETMLGEGRKVFPYGSPDTVAKGTMMTSDIAQDLYGPMGRLMSVEQRPTQPIREWGLTHNAKLTADSIDNAFSGTFGEYYDRLERKIEGPAYRDVMYGEGRSVLSKEALSSPKLYTFYAKPESLANGPLSELMSQEEILLSNRATKMMEYERIVQKKILFKEGVEINQSLLSQARGKNIGDVFTLDNPLANNEFIGLEKGTGKELFSSIDHAHGFSEIIGGQMTGKNTMTVFQKEKYNLDEGSWGKFFSEDAKYMGHVASDQGINDALKAANAPMWKRNTIAGQEVEAVMSGKLVGRNRMALMNQQIEAMSKIASDKIDRGELRALDERFAKRFLTNPARKLGVHRLAKESANLAEEEFKIQKQMVGMANRFGFDEEEMGLTFGLLDKTRASELGIERAVDKSGGVIGLSKMMLGDLASGGGGGKLGSIEATGIRLMAMQGQEGQMFAAELSTRMKGKTYLSTADKMADSMLNQRSVTDAVKHKIGKVPTDELSFSQLARKDLVKKEGRYVRLDSKIEAFNGSSKIYIPGINDELMKPKLVDSGKLIGSPVSEDLHLLHSVVTKGGGEEEINRIGTRLKNTVVSEAEFMASGKGKVIGSQLLTGIQQNAKQSKRQAFGISSEAGNKMFEDLKARAKSKEQKAFLQEQHNTFNKGGTLIGGSWRHPTSGPESFQFVKYRRDRRLDAEMMSIPQKKDFLQFGDKPGELVDTSAMVGMKGDFDRDQFVIAAMSDRDTNARVAKEMNHSIKERQEKYLFDHYAIKHMMEDTKNVKIPNVMAEGGYKKALVTGMNDLTTAKVATPQVNIALQKLKLGMQHSAPEQYRPMAELFFHLEEAAISGKHGSLNDDIYQDIASAVKNKDVGTMEHVLQQVIGDKDREVVGRLGGKKFNYSYKHKDIASVAINAAAAVDADVEDAYRSTRAAKGNLKRTEMNEMIAMRFRRKQGSIDVLPALRQVMEYGEEGVEQGVNRFARKAQSKASMFKKAFSKGKSSMLIGGAIAAGIMLSAPSTSGHTSLSKEGPKGGRGMTPQNLGPPPGAGGMTPPSKVMSSPKVYDMSGNKSYTRAKIRMSMADADTSSGAFMRQARMLSESGNTHIRTRDDRSVLNPQRLASKIHERL